MDRTAQDILERVRRHALQGTVREGRGTWLRQRGEVRFRRDKWVLFTAEQRIDAVDLGFRWVVKVRMATLITATVTDALEAGHGRFDVRVLGLPIQRAVGPECGFRRNPNGHSD